MVHKIEKSKVSLPSDTEVRVTREFAAPRELVWQAHTDPKLIPRWMLGPPGWSMPVCEMDVRKGGKYRWRWRSDQGGQEFGFHGEFSEASVPARMAQSQYYDPGTLGGAMDDAEPAYISTAFTQKGEITTLDLVMTFASKAIRDQAVSTGMTGGMEQGYERLDVLFAEVQSEGKA